MFIKMIVSLLLSLLCYNLNPLFIGILTYSLDFVDKFDHINFIKLVIFIITYYRGYTDGILFIFVIMIYTATKDKEYYLQTIKTVLSKLEDMYSEDIENNPTVSKTIKLCNTLLEKVSNASSNEIIRGLSSIENMYYNKFYVFVLKQIMAFYTKYNK